MRIYSTLLQLILVIFGFGFHLDSQSVQSVQGIRMVMSLSVHSKQAGTPVLYMLLRIENFCSIPKYCTKKTPQ
jgi:hypothetical protein